MTTTPSRTEQVPASRTGALIAVLVGAAFVMILNETVLSVALRDLSVDLGVPTTTTTQWLTSGFLLTMAVVIPTTGYLLDRFTPRQVFLASLGLFTVGTAVAGFAPGFAMLLVGRIVQAGGTAMMLPLLMTTILRLVPAERRGATMGTITIVIAVAPAIGPTIGGAILSGLGWRWMFWLVLPLAVLAMAAGGRWLRIDGGGRPVPLDVVSVLLSAVGFGGLVYGLSSLGGHGGGGLPPWVPVVVGLVALAVFVLRQLRLMRDGRALLDLRPFRRRQFVVALVLTALVLLSLIGVAAVLLPLYLQTVLGTSTLVSGLVVLPGGLLLGLLGRSVGALFDRVGARPLVIPGAVLMAAGLLLFSTLGPGTPLGVVVAFHLVLMGGLALMMTPLMTEALGSLPDELYSHGSAILSTLQQVAGALGTALFVTVAALGSAAAGASPDASGLHAAFAVAGGVGVLAVLLSLLVRRRAAAETPVG
ncbi:Drug resistance transporter EmrB/QacA subfamily [Pseudonocardia sp. Ae717_Ps2]|uniref:DHA2 family efflux MFS transporter permease subunit n=1 Tax=Pseudonocardia sp. Ae717_Ps2 TaxID=1885573 RepID=UPI00094AA65C|nr:DHA2 family efflux MFS transporter permease subunit [Pseudonocardia sp. Ae717_Ps2]OLM32674.1 Drug resistance transporter EmrB/QacA subfamily [Pseudonocardia sp. Ae717_Ps2]